MPIEQLKRLTAALEADQSILDKEMLDSILAARESLSLRLTLRMLMRLKRQPRSLKRLAQSL